MNSPIFRVVLLSILWLLPRQSCAQITDVQFYLDEKDDQGIPLCSHILRFSQYGDPNDKKNIRAVLIGAVIRPGVYYVPKDTDLQSLIKKAGKLQEIPGMAVSSYTNKVPVYREGKEPEIISFFDKDGKPINQNFKLVSGDVIKVQAVVL